jgi:hypothetical protein
MKSRLRPNWPKKKRVVNKTIMSILSRVNTSYNTISAGKYVLASYSYTIMKSQYTTFVFHILGYNFDPKCVSRFLYCLLLPYLPLRR